MQSIYSYCFWQISISPHQSTFLRSLALKSKVILVVQQELPEERIKMGWSIPDLGNTKIVKYPNKYSINEFFGENEQTLIHIFSGIHSNDIISYAFKQAIKNKCKIGIMAEPYDWIGLKGMLRLWREKIDFLRYNQKVQFHLAIGSKGVQLCKKAGYSEKIIHPWGYFVEHINSDSLKVDIFTDTVFNIIYVGSLLKGKGIHQLIKALSSIKHQYLFNVIGDGPEFNRLNKLTKKIDINKKVRFNKSISNKDVRALLKINDLLVLPSNKKEGWGAVINEALMEGTPVLCSDNCGATVLLRNTERGIIFKAGSIEDLSMKLNEIINRGKPEQQLRKLIQTWALKYLNGEVASIYFQDIVIYTYINKKEPGRYCIILKKFFLKNKKKKK